MFDEARSFVEGCDGHLLLDLEAAEYTLVTYRPIQLPPTVPAEMGVVLLTRH